MLGIENSDIPKIFLFTIIIFSKVTFFCLAEEVPSIFAKDPVDLTVPKAYSELKVLKNPSYKWVFMVYLDGDNDLEDCAIDDFLEMSSVGSTSDVAIVALFDRTAGDDTSYGDWTEACIFNITTNIKPYNTNAIECWGEVNMADETTLFNFANWTINNFPAEHYALVLWNHGGGVVNGACMDEPSGDTGDSYSDALTLNEVRVALEAVYNATGRKIDVLGFDACLMGMAEVVYAVRDYADYIVFSEEVEPGDGWPYDMILSNLTANPDMQSEELAKLIAQKYIEYYTEHPAYDTETQSAVNVNKFVKNSLGKLNRVVGELLRNYTTYESEITSSLSNAEQFPHPDFPYSLVSRDFIDFLRHLNSSISDISTKSLISEAVTAISSSIIYSGHLSKHPNATGLSIYDGSESEYFGIDMSLHHQWDELLKKIKNNQAGIWLYDINVSCIDSANDGICEFLNFTIDVDTDYSNPINVTVKIFAKGEQNSEVYVGNVSGEISGATGNDRIEFLLNTSKLPDIFDIYNFRFEIWNETNNILSQLYYFGDEDATSVIPFEPMVLQSLTSTILKGNTTKLFNFTVNYTSVLNKDPLWVNLTLFNIYTGSIITKSLVGTNASDTNYADGKIYYVNLTLSPGIYEFNFTAKENVTNYVRQIFGGYVLCADEIWDNPANCTVNSTRIFENASLILNCSKFNVNSTLILRNATIYLYPQGAYTFNKANLTFENITIFGRHIFNISDTLLDIYNATLHNIAILLANSNVTAKLLNLLSIKFVVANDFLNISTSLNNLTALASNYSVNMSNLTVSEVDIDAFNATIFLNNTRVSQLFGKENVNLTCNMSVIDFLHLENSSACIKGYVNITDAILENSTVERYFPITLLNISGGNPISNVNVSIGYLNISENETKFSVLAKGENGLEEFINLLLALLQQLMRLIYTLSYALYGVEVFSLQTGPLGNITANLTFNSTTSSYLAFIKTENSYLTYVNESWNVIAPDLSSMNITLLTGTATNRGLPIYVDVDTPKSIPLNHSIVVENIYNLTSIKISCNFSDNHALFIGYLALGNVSALNATNENVTYTLVPYIFNITSNVTETLVNFTIPLSIIDFVNKKFNITNGNITLNYTCFAVDKFFNSNHRNVKVENITFKLKDIKINITGISDVVIIVNYNNIPILSLNNTTASIFLLNGTYNVTLQAFSNSLIVNFHQVSAEATSNLTVSLDKKTDTEGYLVTYAIKPNINANATLTLSYKGTGYKNDKFLGLYRCDNWNFAQSKCDSSWSFICNTSSSNCSWDLTNDIVTFNVTGFSAFAIKQEPYCGDGVLNQETEECDGSDFGGKTCSSFGYDAGYLVCTSSCTIDTSNCYNEESEDGGGAVVPSQPLKIFNYPDEISVEQDSNVTFNITVANFGSTKLNNVKLAFSEVLPKDWVSIEGNDVAINPSSLHTFIVTITAPKDSLTGKFEIYFNVTCKEGYKDEAKFYLEIKPYPKEREIAEKKLEEVKELLEEVLGLVDQLKSKEVDVKDIENVIASANKTIDDAEKCIEEKDYDKAMKLLDEAEFMLLDAKALAKNLLTVKIEENITQQEQEMEGEEVKNVTEEKEVEQEKQVNVTTNVTKAGEMKTSRKSIVIVLAVVIILAILFIFYKLYFPQEVPERYLTK